MAKASPSRPEDDGAGKPARRSSRAKTGGGRSGTRGRADGRRRKSASSRAKASPRRRRRAAVGPRESEAGRASPPEEAAEQRGALRPEEDDLLPLDESADASADAAGLPPEDASPEEVLQAVREGRFHVSALNRLSDEEVRDLAVKAGREPGERRPETLYRLLQDPAPAAARETVFVEGLLELHPDGYGFLRSPGHNYVQHPGDVYVSAGTIRRLGLRPGHWVGGAVRRSRPDEPYLALEEVEEVNHEAPDTLAGLAPFEDLTVVFPDQRFLLETSPPEIEMRVMDLFCPLGRGQRAIITSPPRAGKTILLQKLADAIAHNSPQVDIVVLLVDERPEEVTNMRRSVRGDVIASTFDRPASNHVRVAELVMEKVKRMVEFGRHVVLLLDSITRLGRAYNNLSGPSGRLLTGGIEAKALTKPKRFFGAARNVEHGGSLTIVATALVDTGSRMDDVIFEEFKGTGNMEVVLDRDLANARIWPAINIPASGTRNEELLLHPEELRRVNLMRRAITGLSPQAAMELVRDRMKQYKTNAELLMALG